MFETVRYTYRLRPGATAERALLAEWGRCRFLWNEAFHQQKSGNKPTLCTLSKLLTAARRETSWLRAGSQVAQQQTLRTHAAALNHSFKVKGRGRPTFEARKKTLPSLEYTTRGFSLRDDQLRLPGGVTVPVVWSRRLPSEPSSVRLLRTHIDRPGLKWSRITPQGLGDGTLAPFTKGHDMFGDGSIVLLPTPGHTPGSLSMLVRRARSRAAAHGRRPHLRRRTAGRREAAGCR